jgi:hypothetical protein
VTWLLRLYPSPWRRRYGGEVAELLANRGFSLRVAIDLVAGAIDVWLHPSVTLAAASAAESPAPNKEEKTMLNRIMRLDCAGAYGPNLDKADEWKAASVMIGCTLALTGIWTAAHIRFGDNPYIDAVGIMPFFIGLLASMRYTYLKGRPNSVQAVFIAGITLLLTLFFLATGWLGARI